VEEQGEVVVGRCVIGRRAGAGGVGEAGVVRIAGGERRVAAVVVEADQAVGGGGVEEQAGGAQGLGRVLRFGGEGFFGVRPGRVVGGQEQAEESLGRPVGGRRARVALEHGGIGAVPAEGQQSVA